MAYLEGFRKMSAVAWLIAGIIVFSIFMYIIFWPPLQVQNINETINEFLPGCETVDRTMEQIFRDSGKTIKTFQKVEPEIHYVFQVPPLNQKAVCAVSGAKDIKVKKDGEQAVDVVRDTARRSVYMLGIEPTQDPTEVRVITKTSVVPRMQMVFL